MWDAVSFPLHAFTLLIFGPASFFEAWFTIGGPKPNMTNADWFEFAFRQFCEVSVYVAYLSLVVFTVNAVVIGWAPPNGHGWKAIILARSDIPRGDRRSPLREILGKAFLRTLSLGALLLLCAAAGSCALYMQKPPYFD